MWVGIYYIFQLQIIEGFRPFTYPFRVSENKYDFGLQKLSGFLFDLWRFFSRSLWDGGGKFKKLRDEEVFEFWKF